jgi:hypothetical protein
MSKLHITSLPPNTTSQHLHDIFCQIGHVLSAKVVHDLNGNCIVGVVEMSLAEDAEENFNTNDTISVDERRPSIWRPSEERTLAEAIKEKYDGTHLELYKGVWYVFEVAEGHLRWCRRLTEHEATIFYRQYLNSSG